MTKNEVFLSTPSARRATWYMIIVVCQCDISIHALREEGDVMTWTLFSTPWHFYPRPPRGGRPAVYNAMLTTCKISIHALREEGDG